MNHTAAFHVEKALIGRSTSPVVSEWLGSPWSSDMSEMKASTPERLLLLGLIVDQLVDAVITITPDQRIVVANNATSRLFGYAHEELIGMSLAWLMPERFRAAHRRGVDAYLAIGGTQRRTEGYIDVVGLTKAGDEIPMSLSMTCMFHEGQPYLTGVLRDMSAITEARETIHRQLEALTVANAQLQQLADRDHLTGVMNRRALQQVLPALWRDSDPQSAPMAVLLCDLDHFKQYNDSYGHLEGDNCLIAVAAALQTALADVATVARFGGEEFIALLRPSSGLTAAAAAERMQQAVASLAIPHVGSSASPVVTLSIGVASHQAQDSNVEALIRHADDALYVAKRSRNRYVVWDQRLLGGPHD
ncbi:GGDEF domain-containing protein [Roseateles sp. DXS20W]|uniref:diguanylate cyclase n=1 Tax=Pelomonas lactea TaxID=3299030 RepID=A0ABW7GJB5_9BURK